MLKQDSRLDGKEESELVVVHRCSLSVIRNSKDTGGAASNYLGATFGSIDLSKMERKC